MKKVLAKCLKTYPDEDDMQEYFDGKINEPCDIRIYHKGRKYYVVEETYNTDYYEILQPKIYGGLRKEAIMVMLMGKTNTLFIIEGFEKKEITEQKLRHHILVHWETMYGKGAVKVDLIGKDYLVTTDEGSIKITWSWVTSYVA